MTARQCPQARSILRTETPDARKIGTCAEVVQRHPRYGGHWGPRHRLHPGRPPPPFRMNPVLVAGFMSVRANRGQIVWADASGASGDDDVDAAVRLPTQAS